MGRPGRKLKIGKQRDASGRILKWDCDPKETPEQIMELAKWQREKLGATGENFRDPKWGSMLGRMRMWAVEAKDAGFGISQSQYDAIEGYIARRSRFRSAIGLPHEGPAIQEFWVSGRRSHAGFSEDEICAARRNHAADNAVLKEHQQSALWVKLLGELSRNEGGYGYWKQNLGEVRAAANVLIHARRRVA